MGGRENSQQQRGGAGPERKGARDPSFSPTSSSRHFMTYVESPVCSVSLPIERTCERQNRTGLVQPRPQRPARPPPQAETQLPGCRTSRGGPHSHLHTQPRGDCRTTLPGGGGERTSQGLRVSECHSQGERGVRPAAAMPPPSVHPSSVTPSVTPPTATLGPHAGDRHHSALSLLLWA